MAVSYTTSATMLSSFVECSHLNSPRILNRTHFWLRSAALDISRTLWYKSAVPGRLCGR